MGGGPSKDKSDQKPTSDPLSQDQIEQVEKVEINLKDENKDLIDQSDSIDRKPAKPTKSSNKPKSQQIGPKKDELVESFKVYCESVKDCDEFKNFKAFEYERFMVCSLDNLKICINQLLECFFDDAKNLKTYKDIFYEIYKITRYQQKVSKNFSQAFENQFQKEMLKFSENEWEKWEEIELFGELLCELLVIHQADSFLVTKHLDKYMKELINIAAAGHVRALDTFRKIGNKLKNQKSSVKESEIKCDAILSILEAGGNYESKMEQVYKSYAATRIAFLSGLETFDENKYLAEVSKSKKCLDFSSFIDSKSESIYNFNINNFINVTDYEIEFYARKIIKSSLENPNRVKFITFMMLNYQKVLTTIRSFVKNVVQDLEEEMTEIKINGKIPSLQFVKFIGELYVSENKIISPLMMTSWLTIVTESDFSPLLKAEMIRVTLKYCGFMYRSDEPKDSEKIKKIYEEITNEVNHFIYPKFDSFDDLCKEKNDRERKFEPGPMAQTFSDMNTFIGLLNIDRDAQYNYEAVFTLNPYKDSKIILNKILEQETNSVRIAQFLKSFFQFSFTIGKLVKRLKGNLEKKTAELTSINPDEIRNLGLLIAELRNFAITDKVPQKMWLEKIKTFDQEAIFPTQPIVLKSMLINLQVFDENLYQEYINYIKNIKEHRSCSEVDEVAAILIPGKIDNESKAILAHIKTGFRIQKFPDCIFDTDESSFDLMDFAKTFYLNATSNRFIIKRYLNFLNGTANNPRSTLFRKYLVEICTSSIRSCKFVDEEGAMAELRFLAMIFKDKIISENIVIETLEKLDEFEQSVTVDECLKYFVKVLQFDVGIALPTSSSKFSYDLRNFVFKLNKKFREKIRHENNRSYVQNSNHSNSEKQICELRKNRKQDINVPKNAKKKDLKNQTTVQVVGTSSGNKQATKKSSGSNQLSIKSSEIKDTKKSSEIKEIEKLSTNVQVAVNLTGSGQVPSKITQSRTPMDKLDQFPKLSNNHESELREIISKTIPSVTVSVDIFKKFIRNLYASQDPNINEFTKLFAMEVKISYQHLLFDLGRQLKSKCSHRPSVLKKMEDKIDFIECVVAIVPFTGNIFFYEILDTFIGYLKNGNQDLNGIIIDLINHAKEILNEDCPERDRFIPTFINVFEKAVKFKNSFEMQNEMARILCFLRGLKVNPENSWRDSTKEGKTSQEVSPRETDQVSPKSSINDQASVKSTEKGQVSPKLSENDQASAKSTEKGQVSPKLSENDQASEKGQVSPKLSENDQASVKSTEKGQVSPKSSENGQETVKPTENSKASGKSSENDQKIFESGKNKKPIRNSSLSSQNSSKSSASQKIIKNQPKGHNSASNIKTELSIIISGLNDSNLKLIGKEISKYVPNVQNRKLILQLLLKKVIWSDLMIATVIELIRFLYQANNWKQTKLDLTVIIFYELVEMFDDKKSEPKNLFRLLKLIIILQDDVKDSFIFQIWREVLSFVKNEHPHAISFLVLLMDSNLEIIYKTKDRMNKIGDFITTLKSKVGRIEDEKTRNKTSVIIRKLESKLKQKTGDADKAVQNNQKTKELNQQKQQSSQKKQNSVQTCKSSNQNSGQNSNQNKQNNQQLQTNNNAKQNTDKQQQKAKQQIVVSKPASSPSSTVEEPVIMSQVDKKPTVSENVDKKLVEPIVSQTAQMSSAQMGPKNNIPAVRAQKPTVPVLIGHNPTIPIQLVQNFSTPNNFGQNYQKLPFFAVHSPQPFGQQVRFPVVPKQSNFPPFSSGANNLNKPLDMQEKLIRGITKQVSDFTLEVNDEKIDKSIHPDDKVRSLLFPSNHATLKQKMRTEEKFKEILTSMSTNIVGLLSDDNNSSRIKEQAAIAIARISLMINQEQSISFRNLAEIYFEFYTFHFQDKKFQKIMMKFLKAMKIFGIENCGLDENLPDKIDRFSKSTCRIIKSFELSPNDLNMTGTKVSQQAVSSFFKQFLPELENVLINFPIHFPRNLAASNLIADLYLYSISNSTFAIKSLDILIDSSKNFNLTGQIMTNIAALLEVHETENFERIFKKFCHTLVVNQRESDSWLEMKNNRWSNVQNFTPIFLQFHEDPVKFFNFIENLWKNFMEMPQKVNMFAEVVEELWELLDENFQFLITAFMDQRRATFEKIPLENFTEIVKERLKGSIFLIYELSEMGLVGKEKFKAWLVPSIMEKLGSDAKMNIVDSIWWENLVELKN